MLVGRAQQVVVGIDKLHILPVGQLDAPVAGLAQSAVALTHIDDVGQIAAQRGQGIVVGAVVDDNDFALGIAQRQSQDAV